jgi:hypothetical protein
MITLVVVLVAIGGCGKSRPKLTSERMPATLAGLVMFTTSEKDVLAKYPGSTVDASHQIAVSPHLTITTRRGVLSRVSLEEAGICDWVKSTIGSLDGASACPGNRKTGDKGSEALYCLDAPDGVVGVECLRRSPPMADEVSYYDYEQSDR